MCENGGVRGDDGARGHDGAPAQDDPRGSGPVHVEGGEAACWLDRVCPDCGAIGEHPGGTCWRCGRPLEDESEASGT